MKETGEEIHADYSGVRRGISPLKFCQFTSVKCMRCQESFNFQHCLTLLVSLAILLLTNLSIVAVIRHCSSAGMEL